MRPAIRDLEKICQKPRWRQDGSVLARRFARPAALYITWVLVPWPVSANVVTATALVTGVLAACLIATGSILGLVAGAIALNLWYLLDHVDGQVARFRRTESVTGIYLDYMMHHIVHAAVAFAIGYGIAQRTGVLTWTLIGAFFTLGVVLLSLENDCRYKAFYSVLARSARGSPGIAAADSRPSDPATGLGESRDPRWIESVARCEVRYKFYSIRKTLRAIHHAALTICEFPNVVISITLLAALAAIYPDTGLLTIQMWLCAIAILALLLSLARLAKQVWLSLPDHDLRRASLFDLDNRQTLRETIDHSRRTTPSEVYFKQRQAS